MGNARVTAKNLEVLDIDAEKNLLVVKGAVPGPSRGYVVVLPARLAAETPQPNPPAEGAKK